MTIAISGWVLGDDGFAKRTVLIAGTRIAAIGTTETDRVALQARAAEHVDADDCWVIPGLIDAHAHGYATLLRGTENAMPLELWALYTVLYGRAFGATAMRAAILLGAAERIRSGVTGWIDHSPMMHLGEAALDAHARSGLRVGWAPFLHDVSDYALMDLPLPPEADQLAGRPAALDPADYARRFAEFVQAPKPARVSVLLGPNAPQRCSAAAWALWRTLRDRHGVAVHTHLMETRAQAVVGARWPGGLVAEMARQDLLNGRLSVAHGIWLTRDERAILARAGVTLVHNPASNLMLGSGILPWNETRTAGLTMALGTDSANTGGRHDMFATMRLAMMLPRISGLKYESWPRETEVLAMATRNGAAVLGLRGEVGRIAAGQLADLVLVRRNASATVAFRPAESALVQHAGPEVVHAMIVDGQWVMREGRILVFDEEQAIADAVAAIAEIRDRTIGATTSVSATIPDLSHSLGRFLI